MSQAADFIELATGTLLSVLLLAWIRDVLSTRLPGDEAAEELLQETRSMEHLARQAAQGRLRSEASRPVRRAPSANCQRPVLRNSVREERALS